MKKKKRLMENQEKLVVKVYSANGEVTQTGYQNYEKGMIYFDYGEGKAVGMAGESSFLAKMIASHLSDNFGKKNNIEQVNFIFPEYSSSIPIFLDGYFGRPRLGVGAIFLKPLPKRRKDALTKEINKFGNILDRWGKEITLTA